MGMVLFYSVLLQVLNLFSDLLLRWLDPRIRS
jgi:ABC-type dipeptide/oligopeptide/nickel transport system permease component